MTVQELILLLDHARDDARVFVNCEDGYISIIGVEKDENGDVILAIEDDEIKTNLTGDDESSDTESEDNKSEDNESDDEDYDPNEM
jgi:hypothetical protein